MAVQRQSSAQCCWPAQSPSRPAPQPKQKPEAAAEPKPDVDYSEVCHHAEAKGEGLCETSKSFAYSQTLEGKGSKLRDGDEPGKPTAEPHAQQSG